MGHKLNLVNLGWLIVPGLLPLLVLPTFLQSLGFKRKS